MEVFGGAASCRQSLGYKKKREQGQETSGFRHSIFFGDLASKETIFQAAPKKDFKQWLYPSPVASKLYPFFQVPVNEISGFRSINVGYNVAKSSLWTNEFERCSYEVCERSSRGYLIDSQRGPGQGCAGFSLVFFKQDRAHSEPEAARPLLPEQNVEAENRMGSKRGGPIIIFKK